jgi:hypothetical protein
MLATQRFHELAAIRLGLRVRQGPVERL